MPAPIVMVHGAFCGGWAFEAFKAPFEAAGHLCLTPDLPGHGDDPRDVRGLSVRDYARAVGEVIAGCDEPPFVLGHSLGGLVAQIAASDADIRGLMLLAPSAPWGATAASMDEAAMAVGLFSLGAPWLQAIEPTQSLFVACGLDRAAPDAETSIFARMGPESGRALWETFNWWLDPFMTTQVQPSSIRAPVLVISGDDDRIHGPTSVKASAARLGAELGLMDGMGHWLIGEPGWDQVAQTCQGWMASARRQAG